MSENMLVTFEKTEDRYKVGDIVKIRQNNGVLQLDDAAAASKIPLSREEYSGVVREITDNAITISVELYAHLHGHTDNSLLDGMSKVKDYVSLTTAVSAMTDHGNLYGMVEFYKKMKSAKKKPIIAFEAYVEDPLTGKLSNMHTCLFAKNQIGYNNLLKICSAAFEHMYKGHPHVTDELFQKYHEGIIASSACLAGPIQRYLANGQIEHAKKALEYYISVFGKENFYLEVQRHGLEEEPAVEAGLIALSEEYSVPIICTTDSHYSRREDKEAHEVLLCLQTNKKINEPHMKFTGDGYWIHTSEEVEELFQDHPEWLENTLKLADKCDAVVPLGDVTLPQFDIPAPYSDSESYFRHLCEEGFKERFANKPEFTDPEYRKRYDYELDMIQKTGYVDYFLIVQDYIAWAREHDIYVGPGRGSAAGSLIAYCIGITDLDPIKLNLLFERFLNPERVSMPDIDTDFEHSKRQQVIDYVRQKYGADSVCHIVTFGTMAAKMAVKDVSRVIGLPVSFGNNLAKMIPSDPKMTIDKAFDLNPELKESYDQGGDVKKVIDIARALEGCKRHASQHACFDEKTLVTTGTGFKRITDVKIGDLVLTHNNQFKPVIDTIETQTDSVFTVSFYGNQPIQVTGNHPLLVRHQANLHIRKNENSTKKRIYSEPEWKAVHDLEEDDYVGVPVNNESVFPDVVGLPVTNPDFWWLIGCYIGDGWTECCKRPEIGKNRVERQIIICFGKNNRESADSIIQRLESCGFRHRIEEHRAIYKIFINSLDPLYDYLQSFGRNADGKHLTSDILNLPSHLAKEFLAGYMAADGSYQENTETYCAKPTSKQLACGLTAIINKVFHKAVDWHTIPEHDDMIEGRLVRTKEQYRLSFSMRNEPCQKSFFEDGLLWVRVRETTIVEHHQPMYNLTVLDDSSYTANGIAAHNCGIVIAPQEVDHFIPTSLVQDENGVKDITAQAVMTEVEDLSLLKMDFLGLKNMSVIHEVIDTIKRTRGIDLKYQDIPLTDRETYEFLAEGNTAGVFQLESDGMTDVVVKMLSTINELPDSELMQGFENLIAAVALYRPGPMDYIPDFIQGMKDPNTIHYDCPEEASILSPTYGVLVYQEQLMQIAQKLAGYTMGAADLLRKACGKKKQDLMDAEHSKFVYGNKEAYEAGKSETYIPGCVGNGIPAEVAEEIWGKMVKFASYAFNRSHAACYAYIAYLTAYMSCHWPQEFYCGMLNAFVENSDKLRIYLNQADKRNIKILPPDINRSDETFSVEAAPNNELSIRFGLKGLMGVGKVSGDIVRIRDNKAFESYQEFYERCANEGERLNKSTLESLIYAGALDCFGMKKSSMLNGIRLLDLSQKSANRSCEGQTSLFDLNEFTEYSKIDFPDIPELAPRIAMEKEKEVLGFYLTSHPMDRVYEEIKKVDDKTVKLVTELVTYTKPVKKVKTYGIVRNARKLFTKKGDEMLSFVLEDKYAEVKCVVFARDLDIVKPFITDGALVEIKGEFRPDQTWGNQLVVSRAQPETVVFGDNRKSCIIVTVKDKVEQTSLQNIIRKHPGVVEVKLKANGRVYSPAVKHPQDWSIDFSSDVIELLRKNFDIVELRGINES